MNNNFAIKNSHCWMCVWPTYTNIIKFNMVIKLTFVSLTFVSLILTNMDSMSGVE